MKTIVNILLVCALALITIQCEVVSDHLLQDPNNPSPENVSADFLLNNIELSVPGGTGGSLSRMYHFNGSTYKSAYSPVSFNGAWGVYSGVLEDIKTLIPLADKKQLYTHEGIARVIRAYVLTGLVDQFGDVPLSEALDPSNFNPNVDPGKDVYAFAMAQLDTAIIDFKKDALAAPDNDLFYGGSDAKWITLANTLKLNNMVKTRLVSSNAADINSLLAGDVIKDNDQAWIFQYSTIDTNPDSRDSRFSGNYTSTGAGAYMSDYYMNLLFNDQSVKDPRIRYYFYRQTDTNPKPTDVNLRQCLGTNPPDWYTGIDGSGKNGHDPYCDLWNDAGYWGRDHGLNIGIPPDNLLRTTYGIYPAGGRFDADQDEAVDRGQGLKGAGIQTLWMPFYTDFLKAEVELTIKGDPIAARTALEAGVRGSIKYVMGFATGNNPSGTDGVALETDGSNYVPTQGTIDAFVTGVLADYDASSSDASRMNEIAKEYYIALWGNGLEAYNLYRRIAPAQHAPNWHLQPMVLSATPGTFYRSLLYPANFVERNSSVSQKPDDNVKVFWDTNADGILDF